MGSKRLHLTSAVVAPKEFGMPNSRLDRVKTDTPPQPARSNTKDQAAQTGGEELEATREELQSLNNELTGLNSQLSKALELQRTTSNDLQNILDSTDLATLFLDRNFCIRFYTPATKAVFNIIPGDLGRPMADLNSLGADPDLLKDARSVLQTLVPVEREIAAENGACFIRRVLPYRTQENHVEGVVITFADITDRRQILDELGVAKRQAELANAAKTRFLAAASHDLRQPLQTLALVQGLLAKNVDVRKPANLSPGWMRRWAPCPAC